MSKFPDRPEGKRKATHAQTSESPESRPDTPLARWPNPSELSFPSLLANPNHDFVQEKTEASRSRAHAEAAPQTPQSDSTQLVDVLATRAPVTSEPILQEGTDGHGQANDRVEPRGEKRRLSNSTASDIVQHKRAKLPASEDVETAPLQNSLIQPKVTLAPATATPSDDHPSGADGSSSKAPFVHPAMPIMSRQEGRRSSLQSNDSRVVGYSTGSSSSEPASHITSSAQANLTITNSRIHAGRDVNQFVFANKDTRILRQLQTDLNPILSAAYDSWEAHDRSKCFERTRVQVLNDIEKWIDGDGNQAPIYVLDGIAGIGKSTIAQTVAEQVAGAGILGATFFYTRDEAQRMTAKYFFPTIAFQLAGYDKAFAHRLSEVLEQYAGAAHKTIHQQLTLLILEPLRHSSIPNDRCILVVIDALDECQNDEAKTLLTLLAQNISQMPQLKIFVTTRPELHIRTVLDGDPNHERFRLHEIEETIVRSDIQLYLNHCLSIERVERLFPHRRPPWQPNTRQMEMLCGVCGALFIIASTAEKFIFDTKVMNPGKQLTRLLEGVSSTDFSGSKHTNAVDRFYIQIVRSAAPSNFDKDDHYWTDRYQAVVGTIIVLQTPLPCSAVATLLNMESADIEDALAHLHSLVAPTGTDLVFRVHHKSFPDFITNKDRIQRALGADAVDLSSKFLINPKARHRQMATACLRLMNKNLKENMANLTCQDWYKDKTEIQKLKHWQVSGQLAYAVKHWASHFHAADKLDNEVKQELSLWTSKYILAWLEIMCILDLIGYAHEMLEKALNTLEGHMEEWIERATVNVLLYDAMRLVLQSSEVLKLSPMHVYWSGLPFIPKKCGISGIYTATSVKAVSGVEERWNPIFTTLSGHSSNVNAVTFSPDGTRLASASNDNTIRLWDGTTGAHIATLNGHSSHVNAVAFSPDGTRLASASNDNTVQLWDGKTDAHITTLKGHSSWVNAVAFSPVDIRLASASNDNTVQLWDGKTDAHITTLKGHSSWVNAVAFSPVDIRLASASNDNTVRLWNGTTGALITTLCGHSSWVKAVTFSPDGTRLASASSDQTVQLWNGKTGAHIKKLSGHSSGVNAVIFSHDSTRLASASGDKTVRLWDGETGAHIQKLSGHSSSVKAITFSGDSTRLASASLDNTVRLWEGKTGTHIKKLSGHSFPVTAITFSPDGARLASASDDNTVRLWDGKTGAHIATLSGHSWRVNAVAFSPNGTRLASSSGDRTVRLWDGKADAHITTLKGHSSWVKAVAFSPDGTRLASASLDNTVRLWEGKTGAHTGIPPLSGHSSNVNAIAFSPDGTTLASASGDTTVRLWNGQTGTYITTLDGHSDSFYVNAIAFSPDGTRLALGSSDNTVRLRKVETGTYMAPLRGHTAPVTVVAFSPNSIILASASNDRTILLWDGRTGEHIRTLSDHSSSVNAVAFSPDGTRLASVSRDATVQLWDTQRNFCPVSFKLNFNTLLTSILSIAFFPDHPPAKHDIFVADPTQPDVPIRSLCAVIAVERRHPRLSGLIAMKLLPNNESITTPICWFPPHLHVTAVSLDHTGSLIAVGCESGTVLLLDISSVSLPFSILSVTA